jgi:hypothetical protein
MPEATTLHLNCARCGARLSIHLEQWPLTQDGQTPETTLTPQWIACPACHEVEPIALPGSVLRVTPQSD